MNYLYYLFIKININFNNKISSKKTIIIIIFPYHYKN